MSLLVYTCFKWHSRNLKIKYYYIFVPKIIYSVNIVIGYQCCDRPCMLVRQVTSVASDSLQPYGLWYTACQAPLSMEFSRQDYWSVVATPSSRGIFLTQRSNLGLLCCRWILTAEPLGKPPVRPWETLQRREHAYRPSRHLQSRGTEVCTDAAVWISNDWRQASPGLQLLILHHAPMSLVTVNPEAVM